MVQLRRRMTAKRAIEDTDQNPTDGPTASPAKQMCRHSATSGLHGGDHLTRPGSIDAESVSMEDSYSRHKLGDLSLNPPLGNAVNPGKSPANKKPTTSTQSRTAKSSKNKTRYYRHAQRTPPRLVPANDGPGASVEQNRAREQRLKEDEALRWAKLPDNPKFAHSNYGQAHYSSQQSGTYFDIPRTLPVNPTWRVKGNTFHPGQSDFATGFGIEQIDDNFALHSTHSGRIPNYGQREIHQWSAVADGRHSGAHSQQFYSPSSLSSDSRQMRPPPRPYSVNSYPQVRPPERQGGATGFHHSPSNQPFFTNPQIPRAPDRRARQQHTQAPGLVDATMYQFGNHNGFPQQNPAPVFQEHGNASEQPSKQQMSAQMTFAPPLGTPHQLNEYYQQPIRSTMQTSNSNVYHQQNTHNAMPFLTPNGYSPQHTHSAMPPSASNGYDQQHTHNPMPLMAANGYTQQYMHSARHSPIPNRYDQQRTHNAMPFQSTSDYSPQHTQSSMPPPSHWQPLRHYATPRFRQTGLVMRGTGQQEDCFLAPSLDAATNDNTSETPRPTCENLQGGVGPPLPDFEPLP